MAHETSYPNRLKATAYRYSTTIALVLIFCATTLTYLNSFKGVFVFDDIESIPQNYSIRHFSTALFPPHESGITVEGRPILNLSLAFNYAISGNSTWSYHLTNLFIHIACAFLVFGIIHRTYLNKSYTNALGIAACTALLWSIHPLNTESVTYIIQRAESLMGFFYLSSLYCFIRFRTSEPNKGTYFGVLSIISCFLGMGTKEVMVSAPLLILVYDYLFLTHNFKKSLTQYWGIYTGLFVSWLTLIWLILSDQGRGGTVGFDSKITSYHYLLTQCYAITHYLKLVFIPTNLIFYYGRDVITNFGEVGIAAVLIAIIIVTTLWALRKGHEVSYLGVVFLATLAPSSSFIPVSTETMAEHRMYLALIPCLMLSVVLIDRLLTKKILYTITAVACIILGSLTIQRNSVYSSALNVWTDTVIKKPSNPWAHFYSGWFLEHSGDFESARKEYLATLQIKPDFAEAHNDLGKILAEKGNYPAAEKYFIQAIHFKPDYAEAHTNLGTLYASNRDRQLEAMAEFKSALKIDPHFPEANNGYALLIEQAPEHANEAIEHFNDALLYNPNYAAAHNNLANLLAKLSGKKDEAVAHYEEAIKLSPNSAGFHINYANFLANLQIEQGRSIAEYKIALKLEPNNTDAHSNLALLLSNIPGHEDEALSHSRIALGLKPNSPQLHNNLANILASLPAHQSEAIQEYKVALQLYPNYAEAHNNFAQLLAIIEGQESESRYQFQQALQLLPGSVVIHLNFARFLESRPDSQSEAAQEYRAALRLDPRCTPAFAGLQRLGLN